MRGRTIRRRVKSRGEIKIGERLWSLMRGGKIGMERRSLIVILAVRSPAEVVKIRVGAVRSPVEVAIQKARGDLGRLPGRMF